MSDKQNSANADSDRCPQCGRRMILNSCGYCATRFQTKRRIAFERIIKEATDGKPWRNSKTASAMELYNITVDEVERELKQFGFIGDQPPAKAKPKTSGRVTITEILEMEPGEEPLFWMFPVCSPNGVVLESQDEAQFSIYASGSSQTESAFRQVGGMISGYTNYSRAKGETAQSILLQYAKGMLLQQALIDKFVRFISIDSQDIDAEQVTDNEEFHRRLTSELVKQFSIDEVITFSIQLIARTLQTCSDRGSVSPLTAEPLLEHLAPLLHMEIKPEFALYWEQKRLSRGKDKLVESEQRLLRQLVGIAREQIIELDREKLEFYATYIESILNVKAVCPITADDMVQLRRFLHILDKHELISAKTIDKVLERYSTRRN